MGGGGAGRGSFMAGCSTRRRTENSQCDLSDSRKEGVKKSQHGYIGCVTQTGGWLELKGEVLSSEEHWLRAIAPSSLL